MKLRLEKGNIKIRLTPVEIEIFHANKYLVETVFISENNQFIYKVKIDHTKEKCEALFGQNTLKLIVPEKKVESWKNSNQVGIRETIITEHKEEIMLTLEQDLPPRKHKKKQ